MASPHPGRPEPAGGHTVPRVPAYVRAPRPEDLDTA